ncbi:MAG: radical SAM protein, partial [Sulfuricella sp.]|nr:radical SAM protein [Sulfuricella sp.]
MDWLNLAKQIEPLEGIALDAALVGEMQCRRGGAADVIDFYTPSFKSYATSEISACGKNAWPAVSIPGPDCKLQCDHCK